MGKNIEQLLKGVEVITWQGKSEGEVTSVACDSRQCREGSLFTAIRGVNLDGNEFIKNALAAGASFIVQESDFAAPAGVGVIKVANSRKALATIAANFFDEPSAQMTILGVSGTNGKTTTAYLLESVLKAAGNEVGFIGTTDYRYAGKSLPAPNTTPDALMLQALLADMRDAGVTHVAMEVSSHAAALRRVDACHFSCGIFTNLTQEHLDFHGDMENYYQAKRRFFVELIDKKRAPRVTINIDDPYGARLAKELDEGFVSYGIASAGANIKASNAEFLLSGINAEIIHPNGSFAIISPLLGKHNLMNILAATSAALTMGVSIPAIQQGVAALANVPGRLERVGKAPFAVFVDYAHTSDALERVIAHLLLFKRGRLITVFGCGGNRDHTKRQQMGKIAASRSDIAIITSDNPRYEEPGAIIAEILKGVIGIMPEAAEAAKLAADRGYFLVLPDRKEAIETAIAIAQNEDIVLIAGKGSETYQEVQGKRSFFDDRVVASEALARRLKDKQ